MKKVLFVPLCILALAHCQSASAVIGGRTVTDQTIIKGTVYINSRYGACTGIVLSPTRILTANHCVMDNIDNDGGAELYKVTSFGVDGNAYKQSVKYNHVETSGYLFGGGLDLGMIYLDTPLTDAVALPAAKNAILPTDEICVAGVGVTENTNAMTGYLKFRCGLHPKSELGGGSVIAVSPETDFTAGAAPGDSGGPVLRIKADGTYELIGVISGSGKRFTSIVDRNVLLFTDINNPSAEKWLQKLR